MASGRRRLAAVADHVTMHVTARHAAAARILPPPGGVLHEAPAPRHYGGFRPVEVRGRAAADAAGGQGALQALARGEIPAIVVRGALPAPSCQGLLRRMDVLGHWPPKFRQYIRQRATHPPASEAWKVAIEPGRVGVSLGNRGELRK